VVVLVHNGGMRRRLEVVHLDQGNVKEEVTSGNSEVLDRETDRVVIALSARKGNIQPYTQALASPVQSHMKLAGPQSPTEENNLSKGVLYFPS